MAGAPLGTGARFHKLSATLAARGAKNPDALAAYIGRRKYGARGMGRLSHGKNLAGYGQGGLLLADGPTAYSRDPDENVRCTSCGLYNDDDAKFCDQCGNRLTAGAYNGDGGNGNAGGAETGGTPEAMRTPASASLQSATGFSPATAGLMPGGGTGNLSITGTNGIELSRRMPVTSPSDIIVARGQDGVVTIRHRMGGLTIGAIRRTAQGWEAVPDGGQPVAARNHQRTALADLIGAWNTGTTNLVRPAAPQPPPLQAPPQQTPLMSQYGVPAIRALATPVNGSGDGPRTTTTTTTAGSGGGTDPLAGLNPKGKSVYAKLRAKGWPADRALLFAKRAQNMAAGSFKKAS